MTVRYDVAITFPGQGSQRPGMGLAWSGTPWWEKVTEVSDAVGVDVEYLLLDADADALTETNNAQLAVFTLGLVVADAIAAHGAAPMFLAGHSLGEYAAITAAGVLPLVDAARLVGARGRAMRAATEANPGTMAVILGLETDDVVTLCASTDGDVWPANLNSPGQVVIGGSHDAVAEAARRAEQHGATGIVELSVAGAFHTPYMAPAQDELRDAISTNTWADASTPVVANVDARPHTCGEDWPRLLATQLVSPVRWAGALETMAAGGAGLFIEAGAKALTPMVKRALSGADYLSVVTPADLDKLDRLLDQPTPASTPEPPDADGTAGPQPPAVVVGEHPDIAERLIISQCAGQFEPHPRLTSGVRVRAGQVLGWVSGHTVSASFAGVIGAVCAHSGERLSTYQPIAWVRPLG